MTQAVGWPVRYSGSAPVLDHAAEVVRRTDRTVMATVGL